MKKKLLASLLLAVLLVAVISSPLLANPGIDIGAEATDRFNTMVATYTLISKDTPATAGGTITSIEIYAVDELTGCKVGIFYMTNGNTLKCRAAVTLGVVASGSKQTITEDEGSNPIAMAVVAGDYIGMFYATGSMERDIAGGADLWYASSDHCVVDDETTYTVIADDVMSLHGTGTEAGVDDFAPRVKFL